LGDYGIEENSNEKEGYYVDNDFADHYFEQDDCNCDCYTEGDGYVESGDMSDLKLMMSMKLGR
jgi:hypothetical protein